MQFRWFVFSWLCVCAAGVVMVLDPRPTLPRVGIAKEVRWEAVPLQVVESYGRLPLRFEANQGQIDSAVQFLSRGPGYTLFLTSTEAVLTLRGSQRREVKGRDLDWEVRGVAWNEKMSRESDARIEHAPRSRPTIRMKLLGADPSAPGTGLEESPGMSNYFLGSDPAQWRTNVPNYEKVRFAGVYPGVDLIYYGNQRQLEYDFVVEPGGDPSAIQLAVEGAQKVEVDSDGDLVAQTGAEPVRFRKPIIYQDVEGSRQEVSGGYLLQAEGVVSFQVGEYDPSKLLVIDPVLTYSTYLGGGGFDGILAVAVDATGNIYITGETDSINFPVATPFQAARSGESDVFVAKLNPAGSALVYSTYLGGVGDDIGTAIAVDPQGNAYVTGYTDSTAFPIANAFRSAHGGLVDAFVTRLNASGSALTFSTFLGGAGTDRGFGIRLDSSGNVYVTGRTSSTNFPTVGPFQAENVGQFDAFVAKLNSVGSTLVYSTYLGGSQADYGYGIAVDSGGNAYLTGFTASINFPTFNPVQSVFGGGTCGTAPNTFPCPDVFVVKLNAAGSALVYSSFLGGGNDDEGFGIAVDSSGAAYVTGVTVSSDFRTANPFQALPGGVADAFVAKVNPSGSALVYSTYLGGGGTDLGYGIAVDGSGAAYITGYTQSSTFPLASSIQSRASTTEGSVPTEAFVTKLNPAGSQLEYSTYLGGNSIDVAIAIALDASGAAYVAGATYSTNFPTVSPLQGTPVAGTCGTAPDTFPCPDAFLSKLVFRPGLNPGGVVNVASFAPGAAVAAGSLAAAFGTDLGAPLLSASTVPLPTTLADITVRMNNIPAPLIFVSGGQINLQIPWELAGQSQASVVASVRGTALSPVTLNLASTAPGIFSTNERGTGQGAILIASTGEVAAPVGSISGRAARPANRGELVTVYCTGLGGVTNRPATGAPASADPLSRTTTIPTVTMAGTPATVNFSGLSPGFVGLYQVNAQVPENSPTGSAIPVQISIEGRSSNTVMMAVQ